MTLNPTIVPFFDFEELNKYFIEMVLKDVAYGYQPNTIESLAIALCNVYSLYQRSEQLYEFMKASLYELAPSEFTSYDGLIEKFIDVSAVESLLEESIFKDISAQYVCILASRGLITYEDFAKVYPSRCVSDFRNWRSNDKKAF